MGMNVNPKDFSAKVDSTRVVIPAGQKIESDSVWSKKKPKSNATPQKPKAK